MGDGDFSFRGTTANCSCAVQVCIRAECVQTSFCVKGGWVGRRGALADRAGEAGESSGWAFAAGSGLPEGG